MSISDLTPDLPEGTSEQETRRALFQGIGTGIVALLCVGLTYVVPALADYRPWISGEPVPFAHWWGGERGEDSDVPTHLANGQVTHESSSEVAAEAGVDQELLDEAESESDAADDQLLAPPPTTVVAASPNEGQSADAADVPSTGGNSALPLTGAKNADGEGQKTAGSVSDKETPSEASGADTGAAATTFSALRIEKTEYDKLPQELELTDGSLDHFYRQLVRTGRREAGAITRVSHYGDSVIGADGTTSAVRRKLQKRFGSAGKGWVNAAPGWQWYRQKDVIYKDRGWKSKTVASNKLAKARFGVGRYGYGGVAGIGWGARSSYEAYATRLELYYMGYPRGGEISVRIDGGSWESFSTRSESLSDRFKVFQAGSPGKHKFEVKASGGGNVHVYGVTLENETPGIVYDSVQMVGTRSSRLLNYDADHIRDQVAHRAPDLQVFMYGGNEVGDSGSLDVYARKYTEAIQRMRAGRPEASCLVMTPVDHGERRRGRIRSSKRLLKMVPLQKSIAKALGCAFYNTVEAMGGKGASGRWYKSGLMSGDFAHLTKKGDKVLGAMFYKAIMKDFAQWLENHPDA